MATTNIELDIERVTGLADADDQLIVSAQKAVASSIPKEILRWAASETVPATHGGDDDPQQVTLPVGTDNVISVRRDSYVAKESSPEERGFIGNSSSLKNATNIFPKYFVADANRIIVKPDPDATYKIYVMYVDYSKIDDTSDLRSAVFYKAAASEFMYLSSTSLSNSDISTQTPPAAPAAPSFTYTDASVSDITGPVIAVSDMVAMTVSAPSYSEPVSSLTTFPSITWTFPSVPSVPVLSSSSISFSQSAPSFTPPVMSSPDFSDAENWITTEEDSEMLSSRVLTIQSQISEYSARLQESQAAFNKENAEYQAQLQISLQNAQLDSQDDGQIIQKHGSEIQSYQAEVNKIIQGNQQEIAEWQAENTLKLQQYGSDIQNKLNTFNKENVEYQQDIQRKIQNLNKDTQEAVQQLQTDLSVKTANLSKDQQVNLQNAVQNFQEDVQEYSSKLQLYSNELSLYQNKISEEVQGKQIKLQQSQSYLAEADKYYNWYLMEIKQYIESNSNMINKSMAMQAMSGRR